jgi:hypothetical protein
MNLTNLPTSPQKSSGSPDRIDVLFGLFATMFGSSWSDKWVGISIAKLKGDWRAGLARYSDEALRLAYESMLREPWEFPPNQSQFASLCAQFTPRKLVAVQLADKRRVPPPGGFQKLKDILKPMKEET